MNEKHIISVARHGTPPLYRDAKLAWESSLKRDLTSAETREIRFGVALQCLPAWREFVMGICVKTLPKASSFSWTSPCEHGVTVILYRYSLDTVNKRV